MIAYVMAKEVTIRTLALRELQELISLMPPEYHSTNGDSSYLAELLRRESNGSSSNWTDKFRMAVARVISTTTKSRATSIQAALHEFDSALMTWVNTVDLDWGVLKRSLAFGHTEPDQTLSRRDAYLNLCSSLQSLVKAATDVQDMPQATEQVTTTRLVDRGIPAQDPLIVVSHDGKGYKMRCGRASCVLEPRHIKVLDAINTQGIAKDVDGSYMSRIKGGLSKRVAKLITPIKIAEQHSKVPHQRHFSAEGLVGRIRFDCAIPA